jgi:rubrerythrin
MTYSFGPYEIAELAADIEKYGKQFYQSLVELTSDPETKKVFTFLAEQEDTHERTFREIASKVKTTTSLDEYIVDVKTQMNYMINTLKSSAFVATGDANHLSINEAIAIGIKTEQDSISIYQTMQKTFSDAFMSVIGMIIKEEINHLNVITDLKNRQIASLK